jgi:hypothetical protein
MKAATLAVVLALTADPFDQQRRNSLYYAARDRQKRCIIRVDGPVPPSFVH